MLNSGARYAALIGILALAAACTDAKLPIQPAPVALPTPPVPVPPRTAFAGPGTYEFVASSVAGRSVYPYTSGSRYVLRDNGTFSLQMPAWEPSPGQSLPPHEYTGRYTEADGIVTFDFDWNSRTAGAKGLFSSDEMTVSYEIFMSMSDFEDGVYVKKR